MTEEVTTITQIELVKDGSTYSLVFTGRNKHGDILVTSIVPGSIDRFKADHQLPKEIDEERVGCCKVVDVAAKLHEELDEARGILASKDRVLVNLHKTINEYKETIRVERIDRAAEKEVVNRKFSEDLRKLNATIEGVKDSNIEDLKEQKILELKLHHAKSDYEIMRTNHRNTVAKLKDNIRDLEKGIHDRGASIDADRTVHLQKMRIDEQENTIQILKNAATDLDAENDHLSDENNRLVNKIVRLNNAVVEKDRAHALDVDTIQELWGVIHDFREGCGASRLFVDAVLIRNLNGDIKGLEAELSACKGDSAVLMKVVEVMKDDTISRFAVPWRIRCIVGDYLDTLEGPPETPIDDSCIGCERLDALNECKEQIHTQKSMIESLLKENPQVANLKQSLEAASVVLTKTENELSVCKEDSAVLMKVVEIVKNWDDSTGRAFPTLIKILDELVDYTDAPEGPPETPIDDLYRVSVFLEMP